MTFTDERFLFFLPVALSSYFITPMELRPLCLLAMSFLFYATWGVPGLIFILISSYAAYIGGICISKAVEKRRKKAITLCTLSFIIGTLIYTKTGGAILQALRAKETSLLVPIGISYLTLSLVGYIVDIYRGRQTPEKNPLRFLLFALYFPKVLQGPICRYSELSDKLYHGHPFEFHRVCFGLQLMLYGYFKKLIIADRIATFTGTLFNNYTEYKGSVLLLGIFLRSIHLYCDFSGYMDIAEGISEVFGIYLPKNFDHPFFSENAAEFWRRWHISLGVWFKDYVYMPVVTSKWLAKLAFHTGKKAGRKTAKILMTIVPLMIVWVLTGAWHGTGWDYIIWGLYWGIIISISTVFSKELAAMTKLLRIDTSKRSYHFFRKTRTFLLFTIGRCMTIPDIPAIWRHIHDEFYLGALFDGTLYTAGLSRPDIWVVFLSIGTVMSVSYLQEKGSVRNMISNCNAIFRWSIYYAAIFAILIFGVYGLEYNSSDFVYMQF